MTLVDAILVGNKPVAAKAVVYAVADHGTAQHEAVHAYCGQAFGRTGPLWYSEGMAEVGQYWRKGDTAVHCPDYVIEYIHSRPPKSLRQILTEELGEGPSRAATGDSWQNYAWRWALCHLMVNNTNYSARFRPLGVDFLTGGKARFVDTYGAVFGELAFEYRFFLQHVDEGYRVDLCSWDWKRKFKEPTGETPITTHVAAARGWQPTGVLVSPGRRYDYSTSGLWQTSRDDAEVTADGADNGKGRLEGVVFHDFALSESFDLGSYGSFAPPAEGRLYVRCRDAWNQLADNRGAMTLKIKLAGEGAKLARPTRRSEAPAEEASNETTADRP